MPTSRKPVVIITGVSSGIGLATANLFSSKGWLVVGTVRGRSRTVSGLPIDLQHAEMSHPADLQRLVQRTLSLYGRIDALICNAGYALLGPADSLGYEQIRDQFLVNTVAPAELSRLVIPSMRQRGGGVIIYLSSVVGRTGLAGFSMYSASKFALEGMAESLSDELSESNIRIRLIEPSGVNTAFWTSLRRGRGYAKNDKTLGRLGDSSNTYGLSAERVAKEVYLAATDKSGRLRYPLGQTIFVAIAKRLLPDWLFRLGMRRAVR